MKQTSFPFFPLPKGKEVLKISPYKSMYYILKYTYLNFFPPYPTSNLFATIPPPIGQGGKRGKKGLLYNYISHNTMNKPSL